MTLLDVLNKDGVVAIASLGPDGPHLVNTWNSYIRVSEDGRLLIPAGYFHKTQANIAFNYSRNTLRGMHFQYPPAPETKTVRCTRGAIVESRHRGAYGRAEFGGPADALA